MSQEDQTCRHPKFTNDGHPQPPFLTAPTLGESVIRTESSKDLSPYKSPKREMTNQSDATRYESAGATARTPITDLNGSNSQSEVSPLGNK